MSERAEASPALHSIGEVRVRVAGLDDATRVAQLHGTRISEGFLPRLGARFLRLLYRRCITSAQAFVVVAEDDVGVVGFAAASCDLGRLYREFALRDGVVAAFVAAPRLVRNLPRVVETMRYPGTAADAGAAGTEGAGGSAGLPDAEILAVAVDAGHSGRGVGRRLVGAATTELGRRGVRAAKVVAGADNTAALALYRRCGFAPRGRVNVHGSVPSEVLVWAS